MLACSVQIINHLDIQSKFEVFILFAFCDVAEKWRYTNMAAPYAYLAFTAAGHVTKSPVLYNQQFRLSAMQANPYWAL